MDQATQSGADSAPETTSVVTVPGDNNFISPSSAARALAAARYSKRQETETTQGPPASAENATGDEPANESAQADAAPPEAEATGETQEADPTTELSPIEPPRSWSKEKAAIWAKLDRETQEFLVDHDREVSKGVRNAQNDAAEQRKAIEAERGKVEQARQQYETALPILMQNLQSAMQGEFSDIQTMADVQRLANEDFPRYVRWDAQQKQLAAVQQEIQGAQQRQTTERQSKLQEFIRRESELLSELAPEINDEARGPKIRSAAVNVLKDLGFKESELGEFYRGERDISIHDHRLQRLILDSVKLREAQAKAKVATAVPKPPVQRPGAAKPKGADVDARITALGQRIDSTSGMNALRAAAQLVQTRRQAAR